MHLKMYTQRLTCAPDVPHVDCRLHPFDLLEIRNIPWNWLVYLT